MARTVKPDPSQTSPSFALLRSPGRPMMKMVSTNELERLRGIGRACCVPQIAVTRHDEEHAEIEEGVVTCRTNIAFW